MKKIFAILIAIAVVGSTGITAFAANDTNEQPGYMVPINTEEGMAEEGEVTSVKNVFSEIAGFVKEKADDSSEEVYSAQAQKADVYVPGIKMSESGTGTGYDIKKGEMYLGMGNKIVGLDTKLDPDTEYTFNIYYAASDETGVEASALTDASRLLKKTDLDGGTLRLRTKRGSGNISSAKIKPLNKSGATTYQLVIRTKEFFGTKLNDVIYLLTVINGGTNSPSESVFTFQVGYEQLDDSDLDVGEGGIITIANDRPVILKEQFRDIAKSANYKSVVFEAEDGSWSFEGRVSGMGDSNFTFTHDVIIDLIEKFPEQEFKFLNFRSGVTFPSNGEMRIDVSDISEDFSRIYAYLYRNGTLTQITGSYDGAEDQIVFRTNYLGNFVITDKAITDTDLIDDNDNDDNGDDDKDNPKTGAASGIGIILATGAAALTASVKIGRKKK